MESCVELYTIFIIAKINFKKSIQHNVKLILAQSSLHFRIKIRCSSAKTRLKPKFYIYHCRASLALAQNSKSAFWSLKKTDFLVARFRGVGLLKLRAKSQRNRTLISHVFVALNFTNFAQNFWNFKNALRTTSRFFKG